MYSAIGGVVAIAPPTACWKKNGSPCLFSRRFTRSIAIVLRALMRQTTRSPPNVPAIENANPPQARVAIQRLYGCGAVTILSSSARALAGGSGSVRIRSTRRSTAASRLKSIDRERTVCSVLAGGSVGPR
jgi:hypothetical protein